MMIKKVQKKYSFNLRKQKLLISINFFFVYLFTDKLIYLKYITICYFDVTHSGLIDKNHQNQS